MLRLVRTLGLALWALAIGLVIFTTETVADELGWTAVVRRFVREGPAAMIDGGYDSWLLASFWLLTGALIVAWGEYAVRKWNERRRLSDKVSVDVALENGWLWKQKAHALAGYHWGTGTTVYSGRPSDPAVSENIYTLVLIFGRDIADPYISVFSDEKLIWRIIDREPRFVSLSVDFRENEKAKVEIVVRPSAWSKLGGITQDDMKWYDAW